MIHISHYAVNAATAIIINININIQSSVPFGANEIVPRYGHDDRNWFVFPVRR